MSARKLPDKELDQYFRNILKKPEAVPFDEAAWRGMHEKLTASSGGSMPSWFILSCVIGVISLMFFLMTQLAGVGRNEVKQVSSDFPETNKGEAMLSKDSLSATNKIEGQSLSSMPIRFNEEEETSLQEGVKGGQQEIDPVQKEQIESEINTIRIRTSKESGDTFSNSNAKTILLSKEQQESNSFGLAHVNHFKTNDDEGASDEITKSKKYTTQKETSSNAQQTPILDRKGPSFSLPILNSQNDWEPFALQENIGDPLHQVQNEAPLLSRFRLGISLAPGLTTVEELSEFDKAGLDIGVQIEYFLVDRLSITTGAILTRKIYRTTDLSEYQVPMGFWTNGVRPEQINADCNVIDIPLNLRYRVVEGPKTRFFISAGVSSYLMLSEIYGYDYSNMNQDPSNRWRSEFENENQHYFGVYNLSFGLARQVGKNISIEVEPYLKNSFGGVGWGKAQLKSTGALFHLKYHFKTE